MPKDLGRQLAGKQTKMDKNSAGVGRITGEDFGSNGRWGKFPNVIPNKGKLYRVRIGMVQSATNQKMTGMRRKSRRGSASCQH